MIGVMDETTPTSVTDADGNVPTYTMDDGFEDALILFIWAGCPDPKAAAVL